MRLQPSNEPTIWGILGSAVSGLLIVYLPDLGEDLIANIGEVIIKGGPLLAGWIATRSIAWGPKSHQAAVDAAAKQAAADARAAA